MTRSVVLAAAERRLWKICDSLPAEIGDDCYREWAAELPAIIDDPDMRPAPLRWIFVWLFVLDQSRTVSRLQGSSLLDRLRRLRRIPEFSRQLVALVINLAVQFLGGFAVGVWIGANPFVVASAAAVAPSLFVILGRKWKRSKE